MSEEDFIAMVISERIWRLLGKKSTPEEMAVFDKGESAIEGLGEEQKAPVEAYIKLMADKEAEMETEAYLGGVRDGIRLMAKIYGIGKGDGYGTGKKYF